MGINENTKYESGGKVDKMKKMFYESELKVLKILWTEGDMTAKELAIRLKASTDWNKTTSYTVIRKCVEKGLIERLGFNFMCRATMTKEEARQQEAELVADKMFGGSLDSLTASVLGKSHLTASQLDQLRDQVQAFRTG